MPRITLLLIVVLAISLTGCDLSRGTESLPTPPVVPGHIVFASDRDEGHGEIYIMRDDGANVTRLTFNSVQDAAPLLSPDGTKITFRRELNPASVFVMNADGTGKHTFGVGASYVAWSPDGSKLAYVSTGLHGQAANDIYTILPNGTGALRITSDGLARNSLAWSPDGTSLVYGAVMGVCVIPAAGGAVMNPSPGREARWSPDGQRIIFVTDVYDGNEEIYSVRSDGGDPRNLSSAPSGESDPDWGR